MAVNNNSRDLINENNHDEQLLVYSISYLLGNLFSRYSKYIILDRALPDVRDGLKPVQRRILYAMNDLDLSYDKPYKKSARVVGEVIGKYHPHGDVPVYGAVVRMAQPWKLFLPLVDMQGNKGSIDGDSPAAMRYTELRLSSIAHLLLQDLKKDVVDFIPNFDNSEAEPVVLPSYFPNLLVNGATGIAVGMATNIPPHNLAEVIDAIIYRINNPESTLADVMKHSIKGPDFPTGGIIQGLSHIKTAYKTGKGRIIIRSKTVIEGKETKSKGKKEHKIVIFELPFEVVKQDLIKKIDDIRVLNKIHGIKEVRDETDRQGLRIVIDLTHDANAEEILNYLFKNTNLQVSYNFNLVAIANNKPQLLSLLQLLDFYINHQVEVITRKSKYDLKQLKKRLEIIDGLIIALKDIDKVVKLIRSAKNKNLACAVLIKEFDLSEKQAEAIVSLRLYRLTVADVNTLLTEKQAIEKAIIKLTSILKNKNVLNTTIIEHFIHVKNSYSTPRRSVIAGEIKEIVIDEKATLKELELFLTVSYDGWIKAINNRSIAQTETDFKEFGRKPTDIIVSQGKINNLDNLLLITNRGNYIIIPGYKLTESKWKDVGIHINTLVKLMPAEKIIASAIVNDFQQDDRYLVLVSQLGLIKRVKIDSFVDKSFSRAMKCIGLKPTDQVVSASFTNGKEWIALSTKDGFTLKYLESTISVLGLGAKGIKALNLGLNDKVVGAATGNSNDVYGVLTSTGHFKRISFSSLEQTSRTTKGQKIINFPKKKTIALISSFKANDKININLLTNKEKWIIFSADKAVITRVNEGHGKAIADSIVSANNIYLWDLRITIADLAKAQDPVISQNQFDQQQNQSETNLIQTETPDEVESKPQIIKPSKK
ncbi:MAG: DNA topoisomerase IV subunit A [Spiroplasma sp.]|nr:DNA topoisomerase IV subunit A [Spiroplasma sp.]